MMIARSVGLDAMVIGRSVPALSALVAERRTRRSEIGGEPLLPIKKGDLIHDAIRSPYIIWYTGRSDEVTE